MLWNDEEIRIELSKRVALEGLKSQRLKYGLWMYWKYYDLEILAVFYIGVVQGTGQNRFPKKRLSREKKKIQLEAKKMERALFILEML